MCLAKVFINNWHGQPLLQDIAHLQTDGNRVKLETLFGEEKVVIGRLAEIDFSASKILLQQGNTDSKE